MLVSGRVDSPQGADFVVFQDALGGATKAKTVLYLCPRCLASMDKLTLPETNIFAPENGWLEDEFPFGARPIFRGFLGCDRSREGHIYEVMLWTLLICWLNYGCHLTEVGSQERDTSIGRPRVCVNVERYRRNMLGQEAKMPWLKPFNLIQGHWKYPPKVCTDPTLTAVMTCHVLTNYYSSSHNHGSGEWVPTRLVSSSIGSFSTSMIMGGRVNILILS